MTVAELIITWLVALVALGHLSWRWLKVAQLEHYEPWRCWRMLGLWVSRDPRNLGLIAVGAVLVLAGLFLPWLSAIGMVCFALLPLGLLPIPIQNGPARTPRLWRIVGVLAALLVVLAVVAVVTGLHGHLMALAVALAFLVVDLAVALEKPIENALAKKYVVAAQAKLKRIAPTVVAITGSYGKTSTKGYVAHLLSGARATVASPASFNNLMGLCRTVNDRLVPGTEVFVAEMGTYGPGEIRELCRVFPPTVAAITVIGEAHLERMGTRANIAKAKLEITEQAPVCVLNADVPELQAWLANPPAGKRVIDVSTQRPDATVAVLSHDGQWDVRVRGEQIASVPAPPSGHPVNLAIAVGILLAVDVDPRAVADRLRDLPNAPHRAEMITEANGVTVVDDTYNANPIGAMGAVRAARELADSRGGRVITITPGLVEFGSEQATFNRDFAAAATAAENMTLCVTGRTNKAPLLAGARPGSAQWFPNRAAAAAAVTPTLRAGDVLVYENDLPVHYP